MPNLDRPKILFDVMETLVCEPYLDVMPRFFGMSPGEFLAAKHPTSWIEFEEGKITEAEYFARFFSSGRTIDGPGLRKQMQRAYQWIDGMETVLADLKSAGYEMHALSNYSVWFEMIEQSLQISRYVAWTFVSCRTGVRKPVLQAYLGAAEALGVEANQCLFIDDRPENVDAAVEVGMPAIRFEDSHQLRRELDGLGLL